MTMEVSISIAYSCAAWGDLQKTRPGCAVGFTMHGEYGAEVEM